ncbi:hypothetical protein [Kribbella speibonae]|uniref:FkbM family methyltransferase n=1 Tax=Kribbella speibonae TaxID=1572660 RepID=A0A4R0J4S7_9ACTN|nr:hypothetical protein [Kribbella speibonae]TCC36285.1 hypothetical protein E0H92_26905 [Kribbella speibonae]
MEIDRTRAGLYSQIGELTSRWAKVSGGRGETPHWLDLAPYEYRLFSQNGEDGVLCEIFRRIGTTTETFVEFGVERGQEGNCIFLADVLGWQGLFMESHPGEYRILESKYLPSREVMTIEADVTPDSVDDLVARTPLPADLDLMSIDIDGQDLWVWRGVRRYRPRVVVVEYNSAINQELPLTQSAGDRATWDYSNFFGASLAAFEILGREKGYRLVHCDLAGVNLFFVRADIEAEFLDPEAVRRRGPNYYFTSEGHSADDRGRRYTSYNGG